MFQDYYDCPKDLRKDYWRIVVDALLKIAGGAIAVVILLFILIALS